MAGSLLSELILPALAVFGDGLSNTVATSTWVATTVEIVGRETARPGPAPVLLPGPDKPAEGAGSGQPADQVVGSGFVELPTDAAGTMPWSFVPVEDVRRSAEGRDEGGPSIGPLVASAAGSVAGSDPPATVPPLARPAGGRAANRLAGEAPGEPADARANDPPANGRPRPATAGGA
ncbi:MAG: hypothetical protein K2X82_29710, partial [Gemmataceae bacterium]|nr:hypothetical protein [Gemmataceae bacterium]